jgi:hypothetical protein
VAFTAFLAGADVGGVLRAADFFVGPTVDGTAFLAGDDALGAVAAAAFLAVVTGVDFFTGGFTAALTGTFAAAALFAVVFTEALTGVFGEAPFFTTSFVGAFFAVAAGFVADATLLAGTVARALGAAGVDFDGIRLSS